MNYAQLVEHFVTPSRAAAALGVDRRTVDSWKTRRIPSRWQLKAQALSADAQKPLVADEEARREGAEIASYVGSAAA